MANTIRRPDSLPGQTPGTIILNKKEYYRVKSAAHAMGVEEKWIYRRLGQDGGPPHKRHGKQYLLPVAEFNIWSNQDFIP